jgi:hypothetical protein
MLDSSALRWRRCNGNVCGSCGSTFGGVTLSVSRITSGSSPCSSLLLHRSGRSRSCRHCSRVGCRCLRRYYSRLQRQLLMRLPVLVLWVRGSTISGHRLMTLVLLLLLSRALQRRTDAFGWQHDGVELRAALRLGGRKRGAFELPAWERQRGDAAWRGPVARRVCAGEGEAGGVLGQRDRGAGHAGRVRAGGGGRHPVEVLVKAQARTVRNRDEQAAEKPVVRLRVEGQGAAVAQKSRKLGWQPLGERFQ